jgi:hypothetical protein
LIEEATNQVFKVRQGGINTKVEVDIIVIADVADYEFTDNSLLRSIVFATSKTAGA